MTGWTVRIEGGGAAEWLSGSLVLVRQAVQLVRRTDENEVAVQHLSDLVSRLADVTGRPREDLGGLTFGDDEQAEESTGEFELDPARVRRPVFSRPH